MAKLIKIVNIIHRPMLISGFADKQNYLEVIYHLHTSHLLIFSYLLFRSQPKLYMKDNEPHI